MQEKIILLSQDCQDLGMNQYQELRTFKHTREERTVMARLQREARARKKDKLALLSPAVKQEPSRADTLEGVP